DLLAVALLLDDETILRKAHGAEDPLARDALIREVVDREHRRGLREPVREELLQELRDESGMPVVRVDDVRAQAARELDDGPAEEGEALRVVRLSVHLRPAEVRGLVEEQDADAVARDLVHRDGQI